MLLNYVFFSSVVSVVETYSVQLVLNGKMMTASTSFFLTIWSKLSFWSMLGFLLNAVPLTDPLIIHTNDVLMVVREMVDPEMVVPEDASLTLHVVPLVPTLLLASFLNIKMPFLQKLSTLSGLILVEHLPLIVFAV